MAGNTRRGQRRWRSVLLAAAVLPVCAASHAQPPAERLDAEVAGVVVDQTGQPIAGVPVDVEGYDGNPLGVVFGVFSLGFGCLIPTVCTGATRGDADATTDGAGTYRATLANTYVPGTETDTDWFVTTGRTPTGEQLAGATSSFEFEVNTAVQEAPPIPLWESEPTVTVEGWKATVLAPAPPAGLLEPSVGFGNGDVSIDMVGTTQQTIDIRQLEESPDRPGLPFAFVTVRADVRVDHSEGRTIYHQRVTTPAMPLAQVSLLPPSRGAPCTLTRHDGTEAPPSNRGCVITDGDRFFTASDTTPVETTTTAPDGTPGPPPTAPPRLSAMTVQLAAPVELSDVFVYGCDMGCVVEASADGAAWTPLTNDPSVLLPDDDIFVDTSIVASARPLMDASFVRVRTPNGQQVVEVSAWPAQPTALPPPPPLAGADDTGDTDDIGDTAGTGDPGAAGDTAGVAGTPADGGDGVPWLVVLLAVAFLGIACLGLAVYGLVAAVRGTR